MYAGTTIRHGSGRFVGVHQKIDRAARFHLKHFLPKGAYFPHVSDILYFEGNNGPDGLKRKSPSVDEPEHYIDPADPSDRELLTMVEDHIFNLTQALKNSNPVRASFEAAWLAHVIVDGLNPPHHYPMGEKIEELWSDAVNERDSVFNRNVIIGDGIRKTLSKNWQYWGPGGVITKHGLFEIGTASAIATENFKDLKITKSDITYLKKVGFEKVFQDSLSRIHKLKMYDEFAKAGWSQKFARDIKSILLPEMVRVVVMAWYWAVIQSERA
ncbi:hypothetical protein HGB25_02155 [Candidatus Saccharibacteria bacterium]|nr:hypothetical protein [Candidatus Saccharibacteria bacterium]